MRQVVVPELGGPDAVRVVDVAEPAADGLVVVDVAGAGVSWADLLMSRGTYQLKRPLPLVPGLEAAGTLRSAPTGSGLAPGQAVIALCGNGAWAQVVAVPAEAVLPVPAGVELAAAGGLVLNGLSAHFGLCVRAGLRAGEVVVVHGAAGGLGSAAVALAGALGARPVAVVSTEGKARRLREVGVDCVLANGWVAAVRESTGGRGADVVLDPVGGDRFPDSLKALAPNGRLVVMGFTGGIPNVPANRLLLRNASVVGAGWGEAVLSQPALLRRQWSQFAPLVADGSYRPLAGPTFPLDRAADALRLLERREAVGKVVLTAS